MPDKAILTVGDQQIELPVLEGTEGERAIDITKLRDQTGLITFDPSLGNTGVCRSAITFIDGEKGILRYRGIPIEQFTDQAQLRRSGLDADLRPAAASGTNWPGSATCLTGQRAAARGREAPVPAHPARRPADGHPLGHVEQPGLLPPGVPGPGGRGVAGGGGRAADQQGPHDRRLLLPPLAGPAVQLSRSAPALLRQLPAHDVLACRYQQYIVTPEVEDALNLIFILHADHEQNCSTSTVRVVGSARANLFASCAAARLRPVGPAARRGQRRGDGDARTHPPAAASRPKTASATPRTRPIPSGCSASATASIATTIRGRRSSRRPATRCSPS